MSLRLFWVCFPASLGLSAFVGKGHGDNFLVRGHAELERDLELGQLRFESGSDVYLLFSLGK